MLHPCCLTQVVCETETTCIQTPIRWCPPVVFVDLLSIEVSTSGGIPKSSMFIGFSLINHPALGVTPIYGPPMSISEKQFCKIMFQHGRPISGHCIINLLVISWVLTRGHIGHTLRESYPFTDHYSYGHGYFLYNSLIGSHWDYTFHQRDYESTYN